MARFVPRTLRGRRSESGSDEPGKVESPAVDNSDPAGTGETADTPAGTGTPSRRPSPRRTTGKGGTGDAAGARDASAGDADAAEASEELAEKSARSRGKATGRDDTVDAEAAIEDDTADAETDAEAADDALDADEVADADEDADEAVPARRTAAKSRSAKAAAVRTTGRSKKAESAGAGRTRAGGRKVVAAPRTGSNRRVKLAQAAIARLQRTAISLVVWLVVFGAIAGVAGYFYQQGEATDRAGEQALSAAKSAAEAIFSYDYRSFEESVSNGRQHVTGKFKADYAKTTAGLAKTAKKEKAIMRARVSTAGIVEATPEKVDVLLFVNQYRRNANITGEKVDENRVVLTMVYVEAESGPGDWLVSNAVAY